MSTAASILILIAFVSIHAHAALPPARTGDFYVGDYGNNRIAVFDASGAFLRHFSAEGLNGPRGIVVGPDGRTFVASQRSHEVFVFDRRERLIDNFTADDLRSPTGMAIGEAGELYVSSYRNNRVVVFGLDGTWRRTFTGGGMNGPNCVAFDSSGHVYVASAITATVIKFDAAEQFVESFTGGGMNSPMGIARDRDDMLYVAGGLAPRTQVRRPRSTRPPGGRGVRRDRSPGHEQVSEATPQPTERGLNPQNRSWGPQRDGSWRPLTSHLTAPQSDSLPDRFGRAPCRRGTQPRESGAE